MTLVSYGFISNSSANVEVEEVEKNSEDTDEHALKSRVCNSEQCYNAGEVDENHVGFRPDANF